MEEEDELKSDEEDKGYLNDYYWSNSFFLNIYF